MEFDWHNPKPAMEASLTDRDVEESFEDPFAVRLMPDSPRFAAQARYMNLGVSASGLGVFSVYRTNGKSTRLLYARPFTAEEKFFYQKKMNSALAQ
jgi:uncharacterized DUF497 family protein